MFSRVLLSAAAFSLLAGCASASRYERSAANICAPKQGVAVLCVYRNQAFGSGENVDFRVNGSTLARLENDSYIEVLVPPGEQDLEVATRWGRPSSLLVAANEGSVSFLRIEMEAGRRFPYPVISEKSSGEGREEIADDCEFAGQKQKGLGVMASRSE